MKVHVHFLALVAAVSSAAVPPDVVIHRCMDMGRDELESCLVDLVNEMREDFADGIPEFSLPPMTELKMAGLNVSDYQNENNYLRLAVWDILLKGFEDMTLNNLDLDYENKVARWEVSFPEILMQGKYNVDASLSLIPIQGEGTLWARLKNVIGKGMCDFDLVGDDHHLTIKGTVEEFGVEEVTIRLNNLYKDNPILKEAAEAFINQNGPEILALINPALRKNLGDIVTDLGSQIALTVPLPKLAGQEYLKEAFNL